MDLWQLAHSHIGLWCQDNRKIFADILKQGKFDEPKRFEIQPLKEIPKNASKEKI